MHLQSPKLFEIKDARARQAVGRHLLVAIAFRGGVVIAKSNDARNRQHEPLRSGNRKTPPRWFYAINRFAQFASTGDLGDMREFYAQVQNSARFLEDLLGGDRYVNSVVLEKIANALMRHHYAAGDGPFAYGIETIIISNEIMGHFALLDFQGKLQWFSHYVVAGGAGVSDADAAARKNAVAFLEKRCGNGQALRWRKDAGSRTLELAVETLQRFDELQPGATTEFVVVGKNTFEFGTIELE